jgi:hypothetical protein
VEEDRRYIMIRLWILDANLKREEGCESRNSHRLLLSLPLNFRLYSRANFRSVICRTIRDPIYQGAQIFPAPSLPQRYSNPLLMSPGSANVPSATHLKLEQREHGMTPSGSSNESLFNRKGESNFVRLHSCLQCEVAQTLERVDRGIVSLRYMAVFGFNVNLKYCEESLF